ncbi:hypothetical protein E2562_033486 [Oryza meyeriana var. granulata]|uniref:Uncharacterized protein n=1 Tax=Oryza meyeriana var. granulata TaxID=110450 RepID=A0A6G1F0X4_9ORYZ|nr:hypothetical protein E2562_033486 [Oryza meyeriana var. granulata]
MEFRRISEIPDTVIPCTRRREPKDLRTARDVASTPDKVMIRKAARSMGKGLHYVSWNETTRSATIVTSSEAVCDDGAFIDPKPKCGTGGLVIDQHGDVVGMAWSRIAHPVLDMDLRAFELLDASHQEEIELEHNVNDGFIVAVHEVIVLDMRFCCFISTDLDHGFADNGIVQS